MNKFMLAAKKLMASGQGKTAYEYFEAFLEIVQGFPVVPKVCQHTMPSTLQYVDVQNIDTLFPYIKS
jgi:hypothetical protein